MQLFGLFNFFIRVVFDFRNSTHFWDVEALAHERVADSLDSVGRARDVLEDNHVDGLNYT